jgi:hypothetical protein
LFIGIYKKASLAYVDGSMHPSHGKEAFDATL